MKIQKTQVLYQLEFFGLQAFLFPFFYLQSIGVVSPSGCKTAVAIPDICRHSLPVECLWSKTFPQSPQEPSNGQTPLARIKLYVYELGKKAREMNISSNLYLHWEADFYSKKKTEGLLGKKQLCLPLYSNLQVI